MTAVPRGFIDRRVMTPIVAPIVRQPTAADIRAAEEARRRQAEDRARNGAAEAGRQLDERLRSTDDEGEAIRLNGLARHYTAFTRYLALRAGRDVGRIIPKTILGRLIADYVAEKRGFDAEQLFDRGMSLAVRAARAELCYLLRAHLRWSLSQIARFLDGRDHTTILHNVRSHQSRLAAGSVEDLGETFQ